MFHGLKSNEIFCAYVNLPQKRPSSKAAIQYARTISKPVFDVQVPVGSSTQDTFKESLIKTKGTFFIDFAIILLPMNI